MPFWHPILIDFHDSRVKVPLRIEQSFVGTINEFPVMWSVLSAIEPLKM